MPLRKAQKFQRLPGFFAPIFRGARGIVIRVKVDHADEIKPRVMLRPFRTFLEVEQPESEFLLRVDPDEGIGFFEADGGIWKLEAKKNIADYFLKNMGDLIDAGKVVVMQ